MKDKFIFTNRLGLARSLIALSMLLTLILNSINDNIPYDYFKYICQNSEIPVSLNYFTYFSYPNLYIPYIISIVILLLVIIGYYPNKLCILHAWTSYSIFKTIVILEGGDQIAMILSVFLIPISIFDNRKNQWIDTLEVNTNIKLLIIFTFKTVIRVQMCFLYYDAAFEKLKIDEWLDGTAIYYWINHNAFGAPLLLKNLLNFFFQNKFILALTTFSILVLEIFLSFGLFAKNKTRIIMFYSGLMLHFLIFILLGLPTFMLAMYGGLCLYLLNLSKPFNFNLWKKIYIRAI